MRTQPCTRCSRTASDRGHRGFAAESREILEEGGVAADVLDKLFSSTLARISSNGPGEDTLLDRLMQRELELLNSIWDGRRAPSANRLGSDTARTLCTDQWHHNMSCCR